LADWYVYQHDGDPLGPWSTDAVAEAILAGRLAPDVWVAAPGGPRWLRALDVPVIGRMVEGVPTRPRRDSGLRLIPAAYSTEAGVPAFGSTMLMTAKDDEAPATRPVGPGDTAPMPPITREGSDFFGTWKADYDLARGVAPGEPEEDPSTDPAVPPSSSTTPSSPATRPDVAETPSTDRRHTRKGA
jgi:hypothetical protein